MVNLPNGGGCNLNKNKNYNHQWLGTSDVTVWVIVVPFIVFVVM